jgi:hypothetical protein
LRPHLRTSFHHQPEAQHPNFQLSTSWQADYPIFDPLYFGFVDDFSALIKSYGVAKIHLQIGGGPYNLQT